MTLLDDRAIDQSSPDAQGVRVGGPVQTPGEGHPALDAQFGCAFAGPTLPADHTRRDTQLQRVGGEQHPAGAMLDASPSLSPPLPEQTGRPATRWVPMPTEISSLADPALALAADILDDTERTHLANQNRLRQLTRTGVDKDGGERGFGLDESHPDVARLAALVDMLGQVEHMATLDLQRKMRAHPLGPWVKTQRGLGEKRMARLLATIGDPYMSTLTGQPRTVSQLWAYCGLHTLPADHLAHDAHGSLVGGNTTPTPGGDHPMPDTRMAGVAARRRKGQRANWSTAAKTRAWLNIESCMKQLDAGCKTDTGIADHRPGCRCSVYRIAVDRRRQHTVVTHPDWSPGHSLNDGMRIASKALLRDLWRQARDIHEDMP